MCSASMLKRPISSSQLLALSTSSSISALKIVVVHRQ